MIFFSLFFSPFFLINLDPALPKHSLQGARWQNAMKMGDTYTWTLFPTLSCYRRTTVCSRKNLDAVAAVRL